MGALCPGLARLPSFAGITRLTGTYTLADPVNQVIAILDRGSTQPRQPGQLFGPGDVIGFNGASYRGCRHEFALGRGNWTFFGSDTGGKTAAVLRSFVASCKRCGVEPFAWFGDVLSRIPAHSITRLSELLPHNWNPITCPS